MSNQQADYLTVEDLPEIAVGVIEEVAIRDRGLLASAAGRPRTSVFGEDAYPTFASKAAALMHSLGLNHALVDGNQRLAWSATRTFCLMNQRDLNFTVDDAEQLVLAVARGELDVTEITRVLEGPPSLVARVSRRVATPARARERSARVPERARWLLRRVCRRSTDPRVWT